jgi:hypothetical protein
MEQVQKSVFETLNAVNCNEHTEKKNGLTYLSWAWAWAEVKKRYPGAFFTIYENPDGWPYWTDGRYCWVKTGVTIEGLELTEYLPVMDYKNNSIPVEKVTTMDVNKSIQRSLTKACARHGLGLYIYAGEDLPEGETEERKAEPRQTASAPSVPAMTDKLWWQLVRATAEGKKTKSGQEPFEWWKATYNPTQEQITAYGQDVERVRAAMKAE